VFAAAKAHDVATELAQHNTGFTQHIAFPDLANPRPPCFTMEFLLREERRNDRDS